MGYSTLICYSILYLSMFSCGSSHKRNTTHEAADSAKKSVAHNDTTPEPPPPPPGLSPNTARLKGQILNIQSSGEHEMITFQFKVIHVLGSGSATPLLAPQDTLLASASTLPDSLGEGNTCVGLFRHQQVLAQFKKAAPQWRLIEIEHKQDQK